MTSGPNRECFLWFSTALFSGFSDSTFRNIHWFFCHLLSTACVARCCLHSRFLAYIHIIYWIVKLLRFQTYFWLVISILYSRLLTHLFEMILICCACKKFMSAANVFHCDRIAKHIFYENCIRAMLTLLRDASCSDDSKLFCPTIPCVFSKEPLCISLMTRLSWRPKPRATPKMIRICSGVLFLRFSRK